MLGDLFEIKQVEFEGAGTEKLGRRKVITPVAYCNSPVELFKRWMGEEKFEEIQDSGSLIPVKIGCDGGKGFLKWSAQLLEVSANSVSNLMIICFVDIPETRVTICLTNNDNSVMIIHSNSCWILRNWDLMDKI